MPTKKHTDIFSHSVCGLDIPLEVLQARFFRCEETSRAVYQKGESPLLQLRKSVELLQIPLDNARAWLRRHPAQSLRFKMIQRNSFQLVESIPIDFTAYIFPFKARCLHVSMIYLHPSCNISKFKDISYINSKAPKAKWLQSRLPCTLQRSMQARIDQETAGHREGTLLHLP